MAERTSPFQNEFQNSEFDKISETTSQVRADIERFVEGFDFHAITSRIEEFGRENPVGLALGALTLGLAAGFLLKNQRNITGA